MQLRRPLVTAAGAGFLIASGFGIALAGPASAAGPTPVLTAPVKVITTGSGGVTVLPAVTPTPSETLAPTAVPSVAPTAGAGIDVPAGNTGTTTSGDGVDGTEIAVVFAAGLALAGGGVTVARRRG